MHDDYEDRCIMDKINVIILKYKHLISANSCQENIHSTYAKYQRLHGRN